MSIDNASDYCANLLPNPEFFISEMSTHSLGSGKEIHDMNFSNLFVSSKPINDLMKRSSASCAWLKELFIVQRLTKTDLGFSIYLKPLSML